MHLGCKGVNSYSTSLQMLYTCILISSALVMVQIKHSTVIEMVRAQALCRYFPCNEKIYIYLCRSIPTQ